MHTWTETVRGLEEVSVQTRVGMGACGKGGNARLPGSRSRLLGAARFDPARAPFRSRAPPPQPPAYQQSGRQPHRAATASSQPHRSRQPPAPPNRHRQQSAASPTASRQPTNSQPRCQPPVYQPHRAAHRQPPSPPPSPPSASHAASRTAAAHRQPPAPPSAHRGRPRGRGGGRAVQLPAGRWSSW